MSSSASTQLWCCQLSQQLLNSVPFSGRHISFAPLAGNGKVDFHGDSSVSHVFLGISVTLACQRKCLDCHVLVLLRTLWVSLLYTSPSFWLEFGILMLRSPPWTGFWLLIALLSTIPKGLRRCRMFQFLYILFRYVPSSFKIPTKYKIRHMGLLYCL